MEGEPFELTQMFLPFSLDQLKSVDSSNGRFSHYTSAETATKILQSGHVWMRNALTMNDFSEMRYGRECVLRFYSDEAVGGRLNRFLDDIHSGFSKKLAAIFNGWLPHFEGDTYITSLSEHDADEDGIGRLSMWRAYAPKNGVAIILKNTPLMSATDELKAFSCPVMYATPEQFTTYMNSVIDNLISKEEFLRRMSIEELLKSTFLMLKVAVLCTKHPGFREEREWRIFYSPTQEKSPVITSDYATVDGIPQEIHKIPLKHDPANGLYKADIPSLLDRIIIGPTEQPITIWKVLVRILSQSGVQNADKKVVISDIPLRVG
jgi:hypothetical protein